MTRWLAALLVASLFALGCSSMKKEKVEGHEPSPWDPPPIIGAAKWWSKSELAGLDR